MLNDPARFAPPLPSTDLPGPERKAVTPGQVWAAPIAAWWHKVQPDASLGTAFSIGREPDAAWIVVEVCRASGQTACCDVIVQDGMLLLTVRRPLCFLSALDVLTTWYEMHGKETLWPGLFMHRLAWATPWADLRIDAVAILEESEEVGPPPPSAAASSSDRVRPKDAEHSVMQEVASKIGLDLSQVTPALAAEHLARAFVDDGYGSNEEDAAEQEALETANSHMEGAMEIVETRILHLNNRTGPSLAAFRTSRTKLEHASKQASKQGSKPASKHTHTQRNANLLPSKVRMSLRVTANPETGHWVKFGSDRRALRRLRGQSRCRSPGRSGRHMSVKAWRPWLGQARAVPLEVHLGSMVSSR